MRKLISVLVLVFPFLLSAQDPFYETFSTENGLPSNVVYSVLQDSKGYIWICTDQGLCRFNGNTFKVYNIKNGLPSLDVFQIVEDYHHRLWLNTFSSNICYYDETLDSIIVHKASPELKKQFSANMQPLTKYYLNAQKELLIYCKYPNFLLKLEHESLVNIKPNKNAAQSEILFSVMDSSTIISTWISKTTKYNLPVYIQKEGKKKAVLEMAYQYLDCYGYSPKGENFIFHFMPNKLFRINKNSGKVVDSVQLNSVIYGMHSDPFQDLWVSTNEGLYVFKKSNLFSAPKRILTGVPVGEIFFDNTGGLWIPTLSKGLLYCSNFHSVLYPIEEPVISSFVWDSTLYLGTKSNKVYCLKNQQVSAFLLPENEEARHFYKLNDENLLISGMNGIFIFDVHSEKLNRVLSKGAKQVFKCKDSLYLLSVGGVVLFDILNQGYHRRIDAVISALYTEEDRFYYAKANEVYCFSEGKSTLFCDAGDVVLNISKYKGNLIFATRTKGLLFYENGKKIFSLNRKSGFPSDYVREILMQRDTLWLLTENDVVKLWDVDLQKKTFNFLVINKSKGLPSAQVKEMLLFNDALYLATYYGLSEIPQSAINENKKSPPVFIEEIKLGDQFLKKESEAIFSHDQNQLKISFAGLSYKNKGLVNYRYRLHPEDVWISTTNSSVDLLNLKSDEYHFEVEAQNEDGVWSASPAVYSFTILAPWWLTWQALVAYFLVLLLVFYLLYKMQLRKIERKNKIQAEMQNMEIKAVELRQKALRAQINPHFFFNILSSIQSHYVNHKYEKANDMLSRFSSLMRNVLNGSTHELIDLEEEIKLITNYLEIEKLSRKNFDYKIEIEDGLPEDEILIPAMLTQSFLENAILHGFVNRADGFINVIFSKKNKAVKCVITDNGIGREAAKSNKVKGHESRGLQITRERLEVLSAKYNGHFYFEVKDNEKGSGTHVEILMPFE